jgi:hypothetical protein
MTSGNQSTDALWEMLGALHQDVTQAYTNLSGEDTPYNRRACVRTAFASIEGITFFLKQAALQTEKAGLFCPAETALLLEESYTLDNGRAVIQRKFLPLEQNYPFAVAMYARKMNSPFVLEKREGWEAFKSAIEVRNRITHPKRPELLEITDEELEEVRRAYGLVVGSIIRCISAGASALHREVEKMVLVHGIAFPAGYRRLNKAVPGDG